MPTDGGRTSLGDLLAESRGARLAREDAQRRRAGFWFLGIAVALVVGLSWLGTLPSVVAVPVADEAVSGEETAAEPAAPEAPPAVAPAPAFDPDYATKLALDAALSGSQQALEAFGTVVLGAIYRNFGCVQSDSTGVYKVKPSLEQRHERIVRKAFSVWRREGLSPGHAQQGRRHLTIVWRCS
jgi:hypothetical protein